MVKLWLVGSTDVRFRLPLLNALRERGYDGWVSLELMNPTLWQLRPTQVIELGMAALRRVLPDSSARSENFGI